MANKKTIHEDSVGPLPDEDWENEWRPPRTKVAPEQKAREDAKIEQLKKQRNKAPRE